MNDTPGWTSPGSAPSDGQENGTPPPADQPGASSGKWSAEQPPPGQWSPPGAPPSVPAQAGPPRAQARGGPGPAGGPGWGGGAGWGGPPPAAQPGVIPLRPLGLGEILDGSVSVLRRHWRTVLGLTVGVAVVTRTCDILLERLLASAPAEIDPSASPTEALDQLGDAIQSTLVTSLISIAITLIGTLFTTAVLTVVVSRSVLGRPVAFQDAWREARPRLPQLLGLTLLLPLIGAAIVAVALVPGLASHTDAGLATTTLLCFAALPVAVWLMIRFSLASPALMLERQGVTASMRRSAKLVRGAWWRTFGVLLLTGVLTLLVSLIVAVPFSLVATVADGGSGIDSVLAGGTPHFGWAYVVITAIGSVIASAVTLPISAGVTVLLYVDRRIRREALDLKLTRAAGITGYGAQPPGGGHPGS
ncbi:glycerophosphoryl diester phosphodiesterase membrane domain-containing protein [Streptomyces sp. NPDC047002]|uniref:glycerophosphoryl diester phosphodiesterase membrane domain-containing protein n=1 Tax=Streptomyces sp. NPDC047002 TaxID=3155475 RepID=UPI0034542782